MTEELRKIFEEEMSLLPKEIQAATVVLNWVDIIKEIGKKYILAESEINNLEVETGLILIRLEEKNEYASNIETSVIISKKEAEKISEEVKREVFDPISNMITKNVEEKLKNKSPNWKQAISFILSGGDYSIFTKRDEHRNMTTEEYKNALLGNLEKSEEIRKKFLMKYTV